MNDHEDSLDPLTGLPRKDAFDQLFADSVNADGKYSPVSLCFFDIDQFLSINKNHGHEESDMVLKAIADFFISQFQQQEGQLCRIGGDEFAVILRKTEKENAFLRLEKVREETEKLQSLEHINPRPTVSIGLATYPDDGATRQEIIRKADDALFRAKTEGRNRVTLAREEKKVPKTSHFTQGQLVRLSTLSVKEGVGEAELLREALDDLLKKYSS